MAAPTTTLATFHSKVHCKEALVISENNDIAICTEDGFYILEHRYGVNLKDTLPHFSKFFIPASKYVNILDQSMTYERVQAVFDTDDLQAVVLDRTILPATNCQASHKVFSCATWSPKQTGGYGRCVLAGLSHDHRLTLYSSPQKNDWQLLFELSEDYYNQCKKSVDDNTTIMFDEYRDQTYSTAAIGLAWSPTITLQSSNDKSGVEFSLLAVSMKNGDIVLWRVEHPLISRERLSIYKVISTDIITPSALSWCSLDIQTDIAHLAVGYQCGIIKIISIPISSSQDSIIHQTTVHTDTDLLSVSTLCWKSLSAAHHILLSTKGEFVLGYVLYINDGNIEIVKTSHSEGPHTLQATALCCRNDEIVLSSEDGTSQYVRLTVVGDSLDIKCEPVTMIKHRHNLKWLCHGGVLTQNAVYYIAAFSPSVFYDHLKYKFPLAVHVVTLKDIKPTELPTLVSSAEVDLDNGADILDVVRRNLQLDFLSPEKMMKEYKTVYLKNIENLEKEVLQTWRYILLVILTMIPEKKAEEYDDGEMPDSRDVEDEIQKLTCLLMTYHCQNILQQIDEQNISLNDKDKLMIKMMKKWLYVNQPSMISTETNICEDIPELDNCIICNEKYKISVSFVECPNGHKFGLCCKTLLPCRESPFTTCNTCGITAFSITRLKDYKCLQDDIRCSLCCSSLF
ncbi:general transcription factor 3C polypeptide 4 [Patella vulgata]|uniref:general transcription factor 3C polypeptide 4 n=1 Tax=Patella vulgata TaxID=6465 RepID=UPI00217FEF8C|nr:general transcription factor 3C polypeptide 4 [Patella vulgata]